jgi:hypothetical protein
MFKTIKSMRLKPLLIPIIFLFLLSIAKAQIEITDCITINNPGTYVLTRDLYIPTDRPCILINASNVFIDFQGHTIQGQSGYESSAIGIMTINATSSPGFQTGITLKNGIIGNAFIGVYAVGGIIIDNVTFAGKYGVSQSGAVVQPPSGYYARIKNSYFFGWNRGIDVIYSNLVLIENNRFKSNDVALYISGIYDRVEVYKNNFDCSVSGQNAVCIRANSVCGPINNVMIYDNYFFPGYFDISSDVQNSIWFYIGTRKDGCNYNIRGGCGVSGNWWNGFSQNCQNNNRDSFCDYAYQVPGTSLYDYRPLADPQPYICEYLRVNSFTMNPTDTKTTYLDMGWANGINTPTFTCSSPISQITCSVDYSSCNFNQISASCSALVTINTNNAPIGDYTLYLQSQSGDCSYNIPIYIHVSTAPCSGTVQLSLTPSKVNISDYFTASISGLSNCGGTAYLKNVPCSQSGGVIRSCLVQGSGCSFGSIQAPSTPGNYTYYACFDINANGIYESNEQDSKTLEVIVYRAWTITIHVYDINTVYTTGEELTSGNYLRLYYPNVYDKEFYPSDTGPYVFTGVPHGYVYNLIVSRTGYKNYTTTIDLTGYYWGSMDMPVVLTPLNTGNIYAYGYFPNETRLPQSTRYTLYFSNGTKVPDFHPLALSEMYGFGRWLAVPYSSYYVTVEYANYYGKSPVFTLSDSNPSVNLTIVTEERIVSVWIDVFNITSDNTTSYYLNLTISGIALPVDGILYVDDRICTYLYNIKEAKTTYEIPSICLPSGNHTIYVDVCWFSQCFRSNKAYIGIPKPEAPSLILPAPITPEFPFLSTASVFLALIIGFGAGLEIFLYRMGAKSNGLVFALVIISSMIVGAHYQILPPWINYILVILAGIMFAFIMVRITSG